MSDKNFCMFLLGLLFGILLMSFIYGRVEEKKNELSNTSLIDYHKTIEELI